MNSPEAQQLEEIISVQKECCEHYSVEFAPVDQEQLVVISEGIEDNTIPIEGVRYNSPEHMTGWWLTTDKYNGDTNTLKTIHFKHICELRPDIAIYMALPFGFRFSFGEDEHVWFDSDCADECTD